MTRGVDQPFEGLTLRDRIPGGLGGEVVLIRAARRLWTPIAAAGFASLEERLQWTCPSRRLDRPRGRR